VVASVGRAVLSRIAVSGAPPLFSGAGIWRVESVDIR
jgi:hypothetical protein